ncbi:raffinose/stachyose/melibiose transport system substrate-binding protein [Paenibacillus sp. DS2015]|uniref:ABC transporter substrate-binding protein n=1 Tax=Paenibacillus sp. DS2015 TaxID=3373917 RepID=UPI003D1E2A00
MKMTKPMLMLVSLMLSLTTLSACGSTNQATNEDGNKNETSSKVETVKLKFYAQYSGQEKAVYDAARDSMKKIMPEVEVEFEVAAQDDEQKIKTYAAAGTLPDIFFASSGLIETLKKSDNLMLLDDAIKENNIEGLLNETSKPMLWNKDGHSYSVPNVGQWAGVMYYNKELFEQHNVKVPTNYTEYLEAVKVFAATDIVPLALFAKEKWPGLLLLDMAIVGSEPAGLQKLDQGEGSFSDMAYEQGARKLSELTAAGLLSKNTFNTTYDDGVAQFTSGKAAMFLNGAWTMGSIESEMGDKLGLLYTPLVDADKVEEAKWNISGGGFNQGFAVSANSKHKEITAKYAALFSLEFAKQRIIQIGDPNPILVEEITPTAGFTAIQKQYAQDSTNFKTMTTFAWGYENAKFKTALEDNAQKLLAGQSADEFIKETNKALVQARK